MRLRLSPLVPGDLEEIADFIAQDSPRHALRMLNAVFLKPPQKAVILSEAFYSGVEGPAFRSSCLLQRTSQTRH